ncbi:MAG TPA: VWA domain-containing protein [Thiolapillus brandeum]|uniref:VWA domain-containing protein n=1 Tax=Thiolapillus brandeum TaxID=1076588 RepID=A0A831NVZ8_9GAMM|nr:VWA domain-containing protein [Thiolapillus brandeum]
MMHFQWPWMIFLLLVPAAQWLLSRNQQQSLNQDQRQRHTTLLHPYLTQLQAAFNAASPKRSTGSLVQKLLIVLLWLGITLALMRPQWLQPYTEERIEGYDLMLAVDASHSMEALDFSVKGKQVTRMQVVKGVMGRFLEQRQNDRVGLIIFGNQAFVLSPLTLDRQSVEQLLNNLVPRIAGDGTAIGDGLGLGIKKLRQRPPGSRVLILVADGENTAGTIPPLEAAKLAAKEGIRIYAIGVGSHQKEVPIIEEGHLVTRSDLGFDETLMQEIAEITGGAYFRASDTDALEKISQRINELEKTHAESRTVYVPYPLYRWPLALAMLALLMLGLFPDARLRKLQRIKHV